LSRFREVLYGPEGELPADPAGEEPVNRRGQTLALYLILALIGGGSAFLWHSYGGSLSEPAISKTDEISQLKAALQGLQQSQQGTAIDVGRDQEMLQAQQADIKRLSDQISQLATKPDSLQNSARDAQASAPQPVQKPVPKKPASKPVVREPASPTPLSVSPEEKK
jgi:hypothetical protein